MKYVYTILVLLVIGGFWLAASDNEESPDAPVMQYTEEAAPSEDMSGETSDESEEVSQTEDTTMPVPGEETDEMMTEKVFTLDSFKFGYSQTEIRVNKGDTVTINLTNSDGFHDWVVDEFGAATKQINAGETDSVTFVADQAGTFEYYCSVGNHRAQGMVGTLIVE